MLRLAKPLITMFISVAQFNSITVVDVQLPELLLTHPYASIHSRVLLALECLALWKMDDKVEVMH